MDQPNIILVSKDKVKQVKSAILLAFSSGPFIRWLFPNPNDYVEKFSIWIDEFISIGMPAEGVYADEGVSGSAIWLPPGINLDEGVLGSTFTAIPKDRVETALKLFDIFSTFHPRENHWYLAFLGVDPLNHGRGLGSNILKKNLERIDKEGVVAYLESSNPKNISLYERHGFEIMGKVQEGDSPPIHPMIRQPQ